MKRATHLFVSSLIGCLLVASLLSSCTGIHGPITVHAAGGLQPDASGPEPPPPTRVQVAGSGTESIMGGLPPVADL
jgi:hypothetical protein